jgi:hypothetical protein
MAVLGYLSCLKLLLHLLTYRGYGYFRDELYYIVCSQHLDFGYVDHPPLSILPANIACPLKTTYRCICVAT